jgi:hypothetical protein
VIFERPKPIDQVNFEAGCASRPASRIPGRAVRARQEARPQ